jgi:hypothetical protein
MATDTTDLVLLAESCLRAAKIIKAFLATNSGGRLAFDVNALPKFPQCDEATESARDTLRNAAKAIYDLATGPDQCLMESSLLSVSFIH